MKGLRNRSLSKEIGVPKYLKWIYVDIYRGKQKKVVLGKNIIFQYYLVKRNRK